MKKGILISFEGIEGAGKTEQVKRLVEKLGQMGKEVIALREPGGTVVAEKIRQVVLEEDIKIDARTELLLFQAARAALYKEKVLPALGEGKMVVFDRTRDSSRVYQGIVRGLGEEMVENLSDVATQKTRPDLVILLDVSVRVGLERIKDKRKLTRIDKESEKFHEEVRQAYLEVAKKESAWVVVDAAKTADEAEDSVWEPVKNLVGGVK